MLTSGSSYTVAAGPDCDLTSIDADNGGSFSHASASWEA
jgi:hypothetical protein